LVITSFACTYSFNFKNCTWKQVDYQSPITDYHVIFRNETNENNKTQNFAIDSKWFLEIRRKNGPSLGRRNKLRSG